MSISGRAQVGDDQATLQRDAIISDGARQRKAQADGKAEPQIDEQGTAEGRSQEEQRPTLFTSSICGSLFVSLRFGTG